MSSTVQVGGFEISSTDTPEEMLASLTPPKDDDPKPRVTVNKGQPVEQKTPEQRKVSEAAAELGRKGGKAAAKARAAEPAKEPAKEPEKGKAAQPAAKDATDGAEREQDGDEAERPLGKPRDDPRARMLEATRKEAEAKREAQRQAARAEAAERALAEARRAAPQPGQPAPAERPAAAPAAAARKPPVLDEFLAKHEDYNTGLQEFMDARVKFEREGWEQEAQTRQHREQAEHHVRRVVSHIQDTLHHVHNALVVAGGGDPESDDDQVHETARTAFTSQVHPDVLASLVPSFERDEKEPLTPAHTFADEFARLCRPDTPHSAEGRTAPALLLYYTEHFDEFRALMALRKSEDVKAEIRATARILAREEGAVTAGTSARSRVSTAPPPLRPVSGAPPAAEPDITGEIDFDTFMHRKKSARGAKAASR